MRALFLRPFARAHARLQILKGVYLECRTSRTPSISQRAAGKMTIEDYIGLAIGMTMSIFLSCIFRAAGKMTIEGCIGLAIGMTMSCIFCHAYLEQQVK